MKTAFSGSYYDNSTWKYNLANASWAIVPVNATSMPSARKNHVMKTNSDRSVALLFGGEDDYIAYADVWVFDMIAETWNFAFDQQLPLPNITTFSCDISFLDTYNVTTNLTFDNGTTYILNVTTVNENVTEYQNCTSRLYPAARMQSRSQAAMTFDAVAGCWFVQGGYDGTGIDSNYTFAIGSGYNATNKRWEFNTYFNTTIGPGLRRHSMNAISDPLTNVTTLVVYGGRYPIPNAGISLSSFATNNILFLGKLTGNKVTWSPFTPTATPSYGRFDHRAVFNSVYQELWIIGGSPTLQFTELISMPSISNISSWFWKEGGQTQYAALSFGVAALKNANGTKVLLKYGGLNSALSTGVAINSIEVATTYQIAIAGVALNQNPVVTKPNATINLPPATTSSSSSTSSAPTSYVPNGQSFLDGITSSILTMVFIGVGFVVLLIVIGLVVFFVQRKKKAEVAARPAKANFYSL